MSHLSNPIEAEIGTLSFNGKQAKLLDTHARDLALQGGPQSPGSRGQAREAARALRASMSSEQSHIARAYSSGLMSALIFEGMSVINDSAPPERLPAPEVLDNRLDVLTLAARNQILLKLLDHRAFAYDIDNDAKLIRLVANFKGGGKERITDEPTILELSSHTGLSLGPHTEAPYWCSVSHDENHSPAPSALILSALWNPRNEPTSIIPLADILETIGATNALALTSRSFNFTRSDSFVEGRGEDGRGVSILEFHEKIGFAARFNSYRFSVDENASLFVKHAYSQFRQAINDAKPFKHSLSQASAIVINNYRALHCRDVVEDNRRLLVRLFALSACSQPIILNEEPLIVKG